MLITVIATIHPPTILPVAPTKFPGSPQVLCYWDFVIESFECGKERTDGLNEDDDDDDDDDPIRSVRRQEYISRK